MKIVYNFNPITSFFTGQTTLNDGNKSPLEEDVYLLPANSTEVMPSDDLLGKEIKWDGEAWIEHVEPLVVPVPEVTPEIPIEELAATVRKQRTAYLRSSDWTQLIDVPQAIMDKWTPYRQALRDITLQEGFPKSITWPTEPI